MEKYNLSENKVILGLDLGVGSIGWALVLLDNQGKPLQIIDAGVRAVPLTSDQSDGFVKGNGKSVNQDRTEKRSARRGYDRYQLRRYALMDYLKNLNVELDSSLNALSPLELWKLRSDAVSEKLSLPEIARVLMHINQKRGYKHSKSDMGDRTQTEYVQSVNKRYADIQAQNCTVGQSIYRKLKDSAVDLGGGKTVCTYRAKGEVFPRAAYEAEFDAVMKAQKAYYPELFTDNVISDLRKIIFHQRPLKSCKHLVSLCDFEKRAYVNANGKIVYNGPKVAPKSSPLAQLCHIWEAVNNIILTNRRDIEVGELFHVPDTNRYELSLDDKRQVVEFLNNHEKMTTTDLFRILRIKKNQGFSASMAIGKGLKGNTTYCKLKDALSGLPDADKLLKFDVTLFDTGKVDEETGEVIQEVSNSVMNEPLYRLWHAVYSIEDKDALTKVLSENFGINDAEVVEKLYAIDFAKDGFSNKSAKFMRRILPYLQRGLMYSEACTYINVNHSNSLTAEENAERELKSHIEPLKKNELRQPVVEKILNQMINIVNAIFDKYGKIDEVRVELARELKKSKDERNKAYSDNSKRERENKAICDRIIEHGIAPSKTRVQKYRMWDETGKTCMYCGQPVNFTEFIEGNGAEIEHILPRSIFFDNSFSNKVCSCRKCNQDKGNRTAYDFMSSKSKEEFDNYISRVEGLYNDKKISRTKHDRLLMSLKDIPQDFLNRDLRESQYISKKAKELLIEVVREVSTTTGAVTDFFRHVWGYDNILHDLNLEAYRKSDRTEIVDYEHSGQHHQEERIKNWSKRLDHRHHAIDALTVALMKPGYINRLNRLNAERDKMYEELQAQSTEYKLKHSLLEEWSAGQPHFDVAAVTAAISRIAVSFKPGKKVATKGKRINYRNGKKIICQDNIVVPRGALTKESVYGKIKMLKKACSFKEILTNPALEIRDSEINAQLKTILSDNDSDIKKTLNYIKKHPIMVDGKKVDSADCYEEKFVIKTPISSIRYKDLPSIVDKGIERVIRVRMEECNNKDAEFQKSLSERGLFLDERCQAPINSVRLIDSWSDDSVAPVRKNPDGKPVGYAVKRNNHHVALYRNKDGEMVESIVSFWDAVMRKRYGLPVVIEDPDKVWDRINENSEEYPDDVLSTLPLPGMEFLMSMQSNEMFVLGLSDDEFNDAIATNDKALLVSHLYRIQKLSSKIYHFRLHSQAKADDEKMDIESGMLFRVQSFPVLSNINPRKVKVTALGEIIPI